MTPTPDTWWPQVAGWSLPHGSSEELTPEEQRCMEKEQVRWEVQGKGAGEVQRVGGDEVQGEE